MTTDHPSDEQLSAHLDGEAPEVAAHTAGCAHCRARLADLRAVAALLAAPPSAPDPAAREEAIARALAPDAARPIASRRFALVAAAAAVVVAAGIATPLLLRGNGTKRTSTALSSRTAGSGATAAASAGVSPIDGGDLGDQSDTVALSTLVSGAVPPASEKSSSQDNAVAGSSGAGAEGAAAGASPAPLAPAPCTPPLGSGHVVYRARLRWKGTAAEVVAIEPGRRLVVMDRAGCRVLVDRNF